jgi:hypothetical protein
VTHLPLYGALVVGELRQEADPRTKAERHAQPEPAESLLKRMFARWVRKLHPSSERSG